MKYRVTECYVDFPMGASPEYNVQCGLTLEEANQLLKELEAKQKKAKQKKSSVYRAYAVREDT